MSAQLADANVEQIMLTPTSRGKVTASRSLIRLIVDSANIAVARAELWSVTAKSIGVVLDSRGNALAHEGIARFELESLAALLPGVELSRLARVHVALFGSSRSTSHQFIPSFLPSNDD